MLLTGFAGRSALVWWRTFHHQDQQAAAWRAFLGTKNSNLPSDTSTDIKLRRDFDVSLSWSHGSNTSAGIRQLAAHQNVELRLRAEIPAYVAVFVVSRNPTSSNRVDVQMIYPATEARSETTSQRDTRLFLTTTPSDSSNELLYVVAANHPKPLLGLSETGTDVDFMAWREEVTRPHRGLKQRPAISEYIEAFVVR